MNRTQQIQDSIQVSQYKNNESSKTGEEGRGKMFKENDREPQTG
jgi:hypothetical protein